LLEKPTAKGMTRLAIRFILALLTLGAVYTVDSSVAVAPKDLMHSLQKGETFSKSEWSEKVCASCLQIAY
jgi:hypothetical protein